MLQDARGQRPFIVIAPVQTDKTKESIVEVVKELDGIAGARPIRGEEFASIMRTQTLGLPGRWATLAALEAAAVQILNYRYPDDYFSTYARRVRALGEPELAAAAKKFIRPLDVVWVVVGDLAQIEKGVRELNLGEVTRLDADGRRRRRTSDCPAASTNRQSRRDTDETSNRSSVPPCLCGPWL